MSHTLSDRQYSQIFSGFKIMDVATANDTTHCFLLSAIDGPSCRIARLTAAPDGLDVAKTDLTKYDKNNIHIEFAYPDKRFLVVDSFGTYFFAPEGSQPGISSVV